MRKMHRWGAHAMVITVWLHMFRVFMTGSYKPPREFNWSVGVIMLVLTLLLSFTGYLLPWDQLAIWAITVGTNMAPRDAVPRPRGPASARPGWRDARYDARSLLTAGTFVGEAALLRFYVLHCVGFPAHRGADDRALLARPEGRRHLGPAVRAEVLESMAEMRSSAHRRADSQAEEDKVKPARAWQAERLDQARARQGPHLAVPGAARVARRHDHDGCS